MNVIPASSLPLSQLTALFNAGFAGYPTPMALDQDAMRRHIDSNDIDLDVSRVATTTEPIAFVLVGRRGSEAWVGGMGTVADHRRRGIGERTLTAALAAGAAAGATIAGLEVLQDNQPAIALYERLGFVVARDLIIGTLRDLEPPRSPSPPITVAAAHAWVAAHRRCREPWQRADAALEWMSRRSAPLIALAVQRSGEIVAAAICVVQAGATRLVQLVADDEPAAREALRAAAGAAAGEPLRLVNFPVGETVATAAVELGIAVEHVQHEMHLSLAASPA